MPYARFSPSPRLAPFVSELWVQEDRADAAAHPFPPTRVLPTGSTDVAFYYFEPFLELTDGEPTKLPAVVVTGPQTSYKTYAATGRTGIVLVRFRPGAAATLFGVPLHELRDRNIALDDLLPSLHVREVAERVQGARTDAARVGVVDTFLVERLRPRLDVSRVRGAVARVLAGAGKQPIHEVARAAGCSPRELQRRFRRAVGMGPKTFSRIVRLQSALRLRAEGESWGMTAHLAGYQDQAHLANDCRVLTGLTPGAVLCRRSATPLGAYFNRGSHTGSITGETMYL